MLLALLLATALGQAPSVDPPDEDAPAEAPAPEDARGRLDAAWRRLDEGDAEGALLLAHQVLAAREGLAAEALYLSGIALHASGDAEGAVATLRAAEDQGDRDLARDAVFRAAMVELDRGRPREVLRTLHRLGPLRSLPPDDRAKVDLVRATAALEQGRRSGWRATGRALGRASDALTWFRARAHLARARAALAEAGAQSLDVPERRLAPRVLARGAALKRAEEELAHLLHQGERGLALDGLLALSRAQEATAEALLASTVPALTPAQERIYRAGLARQAAQLLLRAVQVARTGVDLALDGRWRGPQTAALEAVEARTRARVEELEAVVAAASDAEGARAP